MKGGSTERENSQKRNQRPSKSQLDIDTDAIPLPTNPPSMVDSDTASPPDLFQDIFANPVVFQT